MRPTLNRLRLLAQGPLNRLRTAKTAASKEAAPKLDPARTRFAPSPTGDLHLGSLRTALYNYLLAKNTGGQFLLRLEDTDRKRLVQGAAEKLYKTLKWAGIEWDEGPQVGGPYGPYVQSERADLYKENADKLLNSGAGYRCFCSSERLTSLAESARQMHPPSLASYDRKCAHLTQEEVTKKLNAGESYVVRFKAPETYPAFHDEIHGEISISPQKNPADIRYDDFVILKSDGMPTYHFANVVDDYFMKISHVIRGDEWLPSTPKHIALYNAFGWNTPKFVHLPLLTEAGGKKLSKRNNSFAVDRLESHILPEALMNFVALLGWYPGHNAIGESAEETLTRDQLIERFSIEHLTKGGVQVDEAKLKFFDNQHFKKVLSTDLTRVAEICRDALIAANPHYDEITLDQIKYWLDCSRGHVANATDFTHMIESVIRTPVVDQVSDGEQQIIQKVLSKIDKTLPDVISKEEAEYIIQQNIPKGKLFKCLRKVLASNQPGFSIVELLRLLGRERVLQRLNAAVDMHL